MRQRGGRKRAVGPRAPVAIPQGPKKRWYLYCVAGSLCCGHRLRIFDVIDDVTRECLAAVVDTSLSGLRVSRELDRISERRGCPHRVVGDTGTELTSHAILKRQEDRLARRRIAPGKPMRNDLVGSSDGRMRDECLNGRLFDSLRHARRLIAASRDDCGGEVLRGALVRAQTHPPAVGMRWSEGSGAGCGPSVLGCRGLNGADFAQACQTRSVTDVTLKTEFP